MVWPTRKASFSMRSASRRPTAGSSSASSVSASRPSAPTGVLSSWLMLATKSRRTASSRRRSVTSSMTTSTPTARPSPRSGATSSTSVRRGGPNRSSVRVAARPSATDLGRRARRSPPRRGRRRGGRRRSGRRRRCGTRRRPAASNTTTPWGIAPRARSRRSRGVEVLALAIQQALDRPLDAVSAASLSRSVAATSRRSGSARSPRRSSRSASRRRATTARERRRERDHGDRGDHDQGVGHRGRRARSATGSDSGAAPGGASRHRSSAATTPARRRRGRRRRRRGGSRRSRACTRPGRVLGQPAGDHVLHPLADVDGVVADALVVAADERELHRRPAGRGPRRGATRRWPGCSPCAACRGGRPCRRGRRPAPASPSA